MYTEIILDPGSSNQECVKLVHKAHVRCDNKYSSWFTAWDPSCRFTCGFYNINITLTKDREKY